MQQQVLRWMAPVMGLALILGSLFVGSAAGWLTVPQAQAQTTQIAVEAPGTITVVGEGKVTLEPDIARVTIGVENLLDTVQEASAANRAGVDAVLAALAAQGIAEADIQTSGFSIFAERWGPEGPLPDGEVRYRVSNTVNVTIRQLDAVGTILDATIEAGANNIYGVEFALDDNDAAETEARAMAIANAQEKAAELAGLTGTTVGRVVSISEVIGNGGGYYPGNFAQQARAMGGGGTPVSPGQLDLIMQLQVVFALGE